MSDIIWYLLLFQVDFTAEEIAAGVGSRLPSTLERTSPYLSHPVFNQYHSEHELLRYLHRLQAKDLSLVHSMIPLGSCTMKLNATTEMIPVTWPELANLHPFAPEEQVQGYQVICSPCLTCSRLHGSAWARSGTWASLVLRLVCRSA